MKSSRDRNRAAASDQREMVKRTSIRSEPSNVPDERLECAMRRGGVVQDCIYSQFSNCQSPSESASPVALTPENTTTSAFLIIFPLEMSTGEDVGGARSPPRDSDCIAEADGSLMFPEVLRPAPGEGIGIFDWHLQKNNSVFIQPCPLTNPFYSFQRSKRFEGGCQVIANGAEH